MAEIPTVAIASDETAGGYVLINADEFDPAKHQRYKGAIPEPEPAPEPEQGQQSPADSASAGGSSTAAELVQQHSKTELREIAAKLNIPGRSRMSEEELAAAIVAARG